MHKDLYHEASLMALKCAVCDRKPSFRYDVGASVSQCVCGLKIAIPDGSARDLLRVWNTLQIQDEITPQVINKLVTDYEQRKSKLVLS